MKMLIIGGTGNISDPITRALVERGDQVTLYNRGSRPVAGTRQITGDRTNHTAFEQQMAEVASAGRFDCVIDMVAYHPDDARSAVRAFRGQVGQYIFCSTVDVYTKPAPSYPVREDFPRQPDPAFEYAYHKAQCEDILEEAAAQGAAAGGGLPITLLRPAATYNDTWAPISLLGSGPALLKRIRQGRPVIVLGDGTSFWTSSHRDDVGAAFVNAVGNPSALGRAYHLTGDEALTWQAYYTTAARVMGAPPIRFVPIPAGLLARITHGAANWSQWNFQFNNIFDNTASKQDLNYRYTISWEEGVRRMVAYHAGCGNIDNAQDDPLYERVIEVFERHAMLMEEEV